MSQYLLSLAYCKNVIDGYLDDKKKDKKQQAVYLLYAGKIINTVRGL